jgi:hypothetical protein
MIPGNWMKSHNNCSLARYEDHGHPIVERENIRKEYLPAFVL